MRKKIIYSFINIFFAFIIIISMLWLADNCYFSQFQGNSNRILYLSIIAFIVQVLKCFRIYFIMFGKNVSFSENIRLYSKTTIMGMLCPFGIGKLFQIYNYGYYIGSYIRGLIAVLIDSFFDVTGFVTIIMILKKIYSINISYLFYGYLILIVGIIAFYLVFFQMYRFWKKYFIQYRASKRGNKILEILEQLRNIYSEIAQIVNGRSVVLYIVSLLIWMVELVGILLVFNLFELERLNEFINCYFIGDVFINSTNVNLRQYMFISYCLLTVVWGIGQAIFFVLKGIRYD